MAYYVHISTQLELHSQCDWLEPTLRSVHFFAGAMWWVGACSFGLRSKKDQSLVWNVRPIGPTVHFGLVGTSTFMCGLNMIGG